MSSFAVCIPPSLTMKWEVPTLRWRITNLQVMSLLAVKPLYGWESWTWITLNTKMVHRQKYITKPQENVEISSTEKLVAAKNGGATSLLEFHAGGSCRFMWGDLA